MNTPRGTYDILPGEIEYYQKIEKTAADLFKRAGYGEIRTPLIEYADLFKRSLGDQTDIASKEMYEFDDRKGRRLALRPEGTAAIARAYLNQENRYAKYYYSGSMFRYERPQKGRQRQFNQIGIESFGSDSPLADIEAITLATELLDRLNIPYTLTLNSLGDQYAREQFTAALQAYIMENQGIDIYEEWGETPAEILQALDSTDDNWIVDSEYPPEIADFLNPDSRDRADKIADYLELAGIPYEYDPYLVRGLDYYNDTIFEISTTLDGKEITLIGGGRYDNLTEQLGGKSTPAVGFALGVERLILAFKANSPGKKLIDTIPIVYLMTDDIRGVELARQMRKYGINLMVDTSGAPYLKQFNRADHTLARKGMDDFAVIRAFKNELDNDSFSLLYSDDIENIQELHLDDFEAVMDDLFEFCYGGWIA